MPTTPLTLQINGQARALELDGPATLELVLRLLEMRGDRIAVELNGEIVPRTVWVATEVSPGDRLEIVHFVGGGRQ